MNFTCTTGNKKHGAARIEDLQLDFCLLAALPAMNQDPIVAAADEREILGIEQRFHFGEVPLL